MPCKRAAASSPPSVQTSRLRSSERLAPAITPPVSHQESCTLQEAESGLPGELLGSSPHLARLLAGCRQVQRRSRSKVNANPYDENGKRRSQEEMRKLRRRITNRNSARHMRKVRAEEEEETRREVAELLQDNLRMAERLAELEALKNESDAWKRVAQVAMDRSAKLRARLAFYEQDSDVLQGLISHSSISSDSGTETFVGESLRLQFLEASQEGSEDPASPMDLSLLAAAAQSHGPRTPSPGTQQPPHLDIVPCLLGQCTDSSQPLAAAAAAAVNFQDPGLQGADIIPGSEASFSGGLSSGFPVGFNCNFTSACPPWEALGGV